MHPTPHMSIAKSYLFSTKSKSKSKAKSKTKTRPVVAVKWFSPRRGCVPRRVLTRVCTWRGCGGAGKHQEHAPFGQVSSLWQYVPVLAKEYLRGKGNTYLASTVARTSLAAPGPGTRALGSG